MISAPPITPNTPVTPVAVMAAPRLGTPASPRRSPNAVARALLAVGRNLVPAGVYLTVAPALMWAADIAGLSAAWPRHWLLAATGALSMVLADRLRARTASLVLGVGTAVLVAREVVALVLPSSPFTAAAPGFGAELALAIAAGLGVALGRWQTTRGPRADDSGP